MGAGSDVIAKGFVLLMAGMPIYVFLKWRASVHAAGAPAAPATTTKSKVAA